MKANHLETLLTINSSIWIYFNYVYGYFALHACLCIMCMPVSVLMEARRSHLDPSELEL